LGEAPPRPYIDHNAGQITGRYKVYGFDIEAGVGEGEEERALSCCVHNLSCPFDFAQERSPIRLAELIRRAPDRFYN